MRLIVCDHGNFLIILVDEVRCKGGTPARIEQHGEVTLTVYDCPEALYDVSLTSTVDPREATSGYIDLFARQFQNCNGGQSDPACECQVNCML